MDEANVDRLRQAAVAVLDRNWRGDHTVPSGALYPHQWSWDTAFIAIGRSWTDQQRAQDEIEHLFTGQWSNGMVPHIVFNPDVADDTYFPGPSFWRSDLADASPDTVATSGITQPPLHARAVLAIVEHARDRAAARKFAERMYPRLVAQHRHLRTARDVAGDGLAAIVHPWESGMDNSPAWDHDLDGLRIPPDALPAYERRDLTHADATDRPSDAAYDRFVYLATVYRDAGYSDADLANACPFLVEDPLFNSIAVWSLHALADLAVVVCDDPTPHRQAATEVSVALRRRLWDADAYRFCARDVGGDRRSSPASTCGHEASIPAATGAVRSGSTPTGCCGAAWWVTAAPASPTRSPPACSAWCADPGGGSTTAPSAATATAATTSAGPPR